MASSADFYRDNSGHSKMKTQTQSNRKGVLKDIAKRLTTKTEQAISQLAIGALFFACRSCEYLKVPSQEKRRTDMLRLQNIRFFLRGKELARRDQNLELADCVSITFEWQKKDERMDMVTQMASGGATRELLTKHPFQQCGETGRWKMSRPR